MERLTQEELAEIRKRAEAAAPGPWKVYDEYCDTVDQAENGVGVARILSIDNRTNDMEFIAQSRSDVPKLLAEIEWLRKEISFIAHVDLVGHPYDTEHIAVSVKSWALNVLDGVGHDD